MNNQVKKIYFDEENEINEIFIFCEYNRFIILSE